MSEACQTSVTVWMTLAKANGFLTVREIKKAAPELQDLELAPFLMAMLHSGRIRIERPAKGHPSYAVTVACKVPTGLTVGEIITSLIRPAAPPQWPRGLQQAGAQT